MSNPKHRPSLRSIIETIIVGLLVTVIGGVIVVYFEHTRFGGNGNQQLIPPTAEFTPESTATSLLLTQTPSQEPATPTQQVIDRGSIGNSVLGKSIDYTRIGNGPKIIVIAGGLHGTEPNAANLVDDLSDKFESIHETIQEEFTIYFLPRLNPDGLSTRTRHNANQVDLNRNWDTNNWVPDTTYRDQTVVGGGGRFPFSEPETRVFSNFLMDLSQKSSEPVVVFVYHSTVSGGLVQPGYQLKSQTGEQITDEVAASIARPFANEIGYRFSEEWTQYEITGEAIHWCAEHSIHCMDIELSTQSNLPDSDVQNHFNALMNAIQQ